MSANVDRRRILGPERSFPPVYAPADATASGSGAKLVQDESMDGERANGEMRPLCKFCDAYRMFAPD
jgi:hypothetical protein